MVLKYNANPAAITFLETSRTVIFLSPAVSNFVLAIATRLTCYVQGIAFAVNVKASTLSNFKKKKLQKTIEAYGCHLLSIGLTDPQSETVNFLDDPPPQFGSISEVTLCAMLTAFKKAGTGTFLTPKEKQDSYDGDDISEEDTERYRQFYERESFEKRPYLKSLVDITNHTFINSYASQFTRFPEDVVENELVKDLVMEYVNLAVVKAINGYRLYQESGGFTRKLLWSDGGKHKCTELRV